LSVHGVALSIGGAGPLNREHLARLKRVIHRYESMNSSVPWRMPSCCASHPSRRS
jgi:uncharacterized protein (UPF0276 family)